MVLSLFLPESIQYLHIQENEQTIKYIYQNML